MLYDMHLTLAFSVRLTVPRQIMFEYTLSKKINHILTPKILEMFQTLRFTPLMSERFRFYFHYRYY
jgi:hypothetical protein